MKTFFALHVPDDNGRAAADFGRGEPALAWRNGEILDDISMTYKRKMLFCVDCLNDDDVFIRVSYSVFVILCQIDETKSWIDATDP